MDKKFIDADTLAQVIMQRVNNPAIRNWLFAIINEIPAADVQEVRHGKWEQREYGIYKCSECDLNFDYDAIEYTQPFKFCPNCGAKMNEDGE